MFGLPNEDVKPIVTGATTAKTQRTRKRVEPNIVIIVMVRVRHSSFFFFFFGVSESVMADRMAQKEYDIKPQW